jgi:tripartite-type tricarboxylate transporter receptor subunit TctC
MLKKNIAMVLAVSSLTVAASLPAAGQLGPSSKPITIIVPYPPGASTDTLMRTIAQKVTERTGQRFVIDNRGGGSGTPAAMAVKHAEPDGFTLFQANLSHVITHAMTADLPYDLSKDFTAITTMWRMPYLLVVARQGPVKTVDDLVKVAKSKSGGVSYASPGVATGPQLLPELIRIKGGGNWVHVPYRGAAPALVDLIAQRVDMMYVTYASIGPFVQEGKLRVIASATPTRVSIPANVPTMAESGYPEAELDAWFGLVGPKNMPAAVVQQIRNEFVAAINDPAFLKQMDEIGVEITTNTPAEFSKLIAADTERLRKLAAAANLAAK